MQNLHMVCVKSQNKVRLVRIFVCKQRHSFTLKGKFEKPIHLLACILEVGVYQRTINTDVYEHSTNFQNVDAH